MNTAARVVLSAACLFAAGCAGLRPSPEPIGAPTPLPAGDPALARLVADWSGLTGERAALRAGVVLKLSGPGGEQRLNQDLILARPARLRMEIQSFLMTAAVLVADEHGYDYFQSLDRYRESGPVHPGLLWDIAGVPLTLDDAVHFLLGGPPPRRGLRPSGGERAPDASVRVDLQDSSGRLARRLRFDGEGRLLGAEDWVAGQLRWQVGYDRYRDVDARPFAHSIEFDFPRFSSRATVAFRTVVLNPEVPDAAFRIDVPDDGGATP